MRRKLNSRKNWHASVEKNSIYKDNACRKLTAGVLSVLLTGFEGVLKADGTVEHQMLGGRILGVGAEVTQTHELEGCGSFGISQRSFHLTAGENFQGVGVQVLHESFHAGGIGIHGVKQVIVQTDLGVHCGLGIHPMDSRALDLAQAQYMPID